MKSLILAVAGLCVALPAAAQSVDQRAQTQQERIQQGVASGALTPRETARLESREAKEKRVEARLKARHHGLTGHDVQRLNKLEDRNSNAIDKLKNN